MLNRDISRAGQSIVRGAWYLAAWSDELTDEPLGVVLLGDPVVLFRRTDGTPAAIEDRCIHRSLPLSLGKVCGDVIECGYHGMQYDGTGRCIRIPGQERIVVSTRVRQYPVVEQDRCIWVWTGAADAVDPARITRFPWMALPGWRQTKLHARIEANYQLIIDNLLDLSHLAYVHSSTVGSPELADQAHVNSELTDGGVKVSRWTLDVPPAPTYAQFGYSAGNVDRWQITQFIAPSTLVIRNGSARAGTGADQGRGEDRWEFIVCHGISPETDRVTNYFWAVTHDFLADDPIRAGEFHRQSHHVIHEDIAVFVAQQKMLDQLPDAATVNIAYDAGPMQARLLIDRMRKEEVPRREVVDVPA
jgi:phenylpropionate dioxygenase-like ring-hydroxylating dioxygenase large terminal subunit